MQKPNNKTFTTMRTSNLEYFTGFDSFKTSYYFIHIFWDKARYMPGIGRQKFITQSK
jgi:hypothetical protein